MHSRAHRGGFALGAVLWLLTVCTILATALVLRGRSAYEATRNRANAERAYWIVEGCVAEMREALDATLARTSPTALPAVWRTLDVAVTLSLPPQLECRATLQAVGSRIDVNSASDTLLRKYFGETEISTVADALADAIIDWRDADELPRPSGAERAWYTANQRPAPRNGSLVSVEELTLIRGLEARPDLTANLTVEPSRICLTTAPASVLAALPGFTAATVTQVLTDRANGAWIGDLNVLRGRVSPASADSILTHFQELSLITTIEPDGWILTVTASAGSPAIAVATELRLDRYANRLLVVRRRTQ
ncbi:MAG TPA: hypothetical protein VF461_17705 [Gemmatimonadaceae bacterium]